MFDGVSYGLLAGMMACGLMLLVLFGEALHAYHALCCASALVALAAAAGTASRGPLGQWPGASALVLALASTLWAVCRLQFGRYLLQLKHLALWLDQLAQLLLFGFAGAAAYALWGAMTHPHWTLHITQALVMASTVILLIGSAMALRRPSWPVALYGLSAVVLLGGSAVSTMTSGEGFPWPRNPLNVAKAAVISELWLFVAAMTLRLRQMMLSEKALEQRARQLAQSMENDALTGAASRAAFETRTEEWVRDGRPFSLMMLDLNGFRRVNERHGRAGGDAVLAAVAQRLREQVRADDMVARLGGDKFAILLKGSPARHKLAEMAIRMLTAGARPVEYEKRLVAGGDLSLGIACHPADAASFEGILKAGEVALQHCKKQRLGPSYVFASELPAGLYAEAHPAV